MAALSLGALAAPAGADLLDSTDLGALGTRTADARPDSPVVIDGVRYFVADDGDHGREVFRATGTGPATIVKDIAPGGTSSDPQQLMTDGDRLYFIATDGSASDGNAGWYAYASDGTAAGTVALAAVRSPVSGPITSQRLLGAFDGHVYFFTAFFNDPDYGGELMGSDGTVAGTRMVKDINPGPGGSGLQKGYVADDRMYFLAFDGTDGQELWVTDGTAAGTHITKDLAPGSASVNANNFAPVGRSVYFTVDSDVYVSDGASAGTHVIKTFAAGAGAHGFVASAGRTWFAAGTAAGGDALYKTDGTSAGTTLVKTINTTTGASHVDELTVAGSTLFFTADGGTGSGIELWASDGTAAGTHQVKDINPGAADSAIDELTAAGGSVFDGADDGTHGRELWTSDGTAAGTQLVKDINSGAGDGDGFGLSWDGSGLWLPATDGTHGAQPWTSDGTAAGTVQHQLNGSGTFTATPAVPVGSSTLVAGVHDATTSSDRLVVSDVATAAGTHTLSSAFSAIGDLVAFDGKAYFSGTTAAGRQLWVTDGTDAGTQPVTAGRVNLWDGLYVAGGRVWFRASTGSTNGAQVWSSDGTDAGTHVVTDDTAVGDVDELTAFGSGVAFSGLDSSSGRYTAFVADGTSGVRALSGGGAPVASATGFGVLGNRLFYTGLGTTGRTELYVSDGTTAASIGSGPSGIQRWVASGSKLYYMALSPSDGYQLYVTDGTASGSHLATTISTDHQYSHWPENVTPIGGDKVVFDVRGTPGLWVSDGTPAGTTRILDAVGEQPAIASVGGTVYVAGQDGAHGTELWTTDGTAAGTVLAADLVDGAGSSRPRVLGGLANGRLLVLGDAAGGGSELYAADAEGDDDNNSGGGGNNGGGGNSNDNNNAGGGGGSPAQVQAGPATVVAQSAPGGRVVPAKLTLRVGRTAARYRVSGRLTVPKGARCQGTVTVTFRRGTRTVATVRTRLRRDCTYAVTLSRATSKRLAARRGKLTAAARFAAIRR